MTEKRLARATWGPYCGSLPHALPQIRLVLVDDHPVLREGVKALLGAERDLKVVGEASDGASALEQVGKLRPDLVVMDVSLPGPSGADTTRDLKRSYPEINVLALSVHEELAFARAMLDAGASGYALKRTACDELVRAVRLVAGGERYVDPVLAGQLRCTGREPGANGGPALGLSEREAQVVRLLAQGLTMKEMADRLSLSPRTLETYRARAMEKLGMKSRADLVRYAIRRGWLDAS